jgi:hypothetical protein
LPDPLEALLALACGILLGLILGFVLCIHQ